MEDDEDRELHDGLKQDLHSLRARDATLDALAAEIQHAAAVRAAAEARHAEEVYTGLRKLCCESQKKILVTGSAGYLGAALHMTLRELGIEGRVIVIGIRG